MDEEVDAGVPIALWLVMRKRLQSLAVSTVLLIPASAAQAQISIGIRIGEPPPPRAYYVPRQPGPGYEWVDGYWYPQGSHYRWHDGYWTRAPFEGAYWVPPYYDGGQYFAGRWESRHGYLAHDHHWDHDKHRDEHHGPHRYDHDNELR